MNIIETIKNLFKTKKVTLLHTQPLRKIKGENKPFEAVLTDNNGNPLAGKKIRFVANGVAYERTTDDNGYAKLDVYWNPCSRTIEVVFEGDETYSSCNTFNYVTISPKIIANDATLTQGEEYTAKFVDVDNNPLANVGGAFIINGVGYDRTSDDNGVIKIGIYLNPKTYSIETISYQNKVTTNVTVKAKPVENKPSSTPSKPSVDCSSPWTQTPLLLNQRPGSLGQVTPYSCGPHSLMQGFYHLTGIDVAESTIMSWAGTTTAGTGHAGLNTAVAMFNKKYNQNIKIAWKNMSDFGSTTAEQFRNIGKLKCEGKYVFFHILYRNQYGHYETYKTNHGVDQRFDIANSLGSRSGTGYYGYIENRSYGVQRQYIGGISQPSVAILYK